jgi:hypothetical protein
VTGVQTCALPIYRSKPPSAVARDTIRLSEYNGNKPVTRAQKESDLASHANNSFLFQQNDSGCIMSTPVQLVNNQSASDSSAVAIAMEQQTLGAIQLSRAATKINHRTVADCSMQTSAVSVGTVTTFTETTMPLCTPKASQTIPPVSTKVQTYPQANQFKRVQTMPILTAEVVVQSENIGYETHATMTERAENRNVTVSTDPPVSRHIQTYKGPQKDKQIGVSIDSNQCEGAEGVSQYTQTDNMCEVIQSYDVIGSAPWIENSTQFLARNAAVNSDLKLSLEQLRMMCASYQSTSGVT